MRVRMKVGLSGTRNGQPWPASGDEVNLPDAEGADLCAAGLAEPVAVREDTEKRPTAKRTSARRKSEG